MERHDITAADGWKFYDGNILEDKNVREYNRVFFEGKTRPLGWVNYVLGNVQYTDKIEEKNYIKLFGEAELLFPVEQIAYLKGNIDYILVTQFPSFVSRCKIFPLTIAPVYLRL